MREFFIFSCCERCGGVFSSRTLEVGLLIGLSPSTWQPTRQSPRLSVLALECEAHRVLSMTIAKHYGFDIINPCRL